MNNSHIAIFAFPDMTLLDFVGPYEVFCQLPYFGYDYRAWRPWRKQFNDRQDRA